MIKITHLFLLFWITSIESSFHFDWLPTNSHLIPLFKMVPFNILKAFIFFILKSFLLSSKWMISFSICIYKRVDSLRTGWFYFCVIDNGIHSYSSLCLHSSILFKKKKRKLQKYLYGIFRAAEKSISLPLYDYKERERERYSNVTIFSQT